MMNKHWTFVSTCLLVIIIIYVGHTAAQSASDLCTSDSAKESTKVAVNADAKGWAPDGPEISVQVVAKGDSIKSIAIWTEAVNNNNHLGSWILMPGYKFTHCGIGMSTLASTDDLNLSQVTYKWKPPRANDGPIPLIPGQQTPAPSPIPSNKRSLVARQAPSTPSFGPIVFKGIVQFKSDPAIYSFKSDIIPISNANVPSTNSTTSNTPSGTASGTPSGTNNPGSVDSSKPSHSPSVSATNSKFLYKGFNLLFILTLSTLLLAL